jgi:flagellar biosynthesis/type III secretory pathway protein FliH
MEIERRKAVEILETLTEVRAVAKVIKNESWFHYEDMITEVIKSATASSYDAGYEDGFSDGYNSAKEEVSENERAD